MLMEWLVRSDEVESKHGLIFDVITVFFYENVLLYSTEFIAYYAANEFSALLL